MLHGFITSRCLKNGASKQLLSLTLMPGRRWRAFLSMTLCFETASPELQGGGFETQVAIYIWRPSSLKSRRIAKEHT
jgi:hypothetical protein